MTQEHMSDEERSRLREMITKAGPAPKDFEDELLDLDLLAELRRKNPATEARYEQLRNAAARRLLAEGPRYFLGGNGEKRYAYAVQPEGIDVDLEELRNARDRGEITPELYAEVTKEVVDAERFAAAVRRGGNSRSRKPGIPPATFIKVARKVPRTPHVRFVSPDGLDDED